MDNNSMIEIIKSRLKFKVLLLIGPPLSGKGTQASRLSNLLQIPAVSSGDIFRKEVASGSELGKKMKEFMDRGELIPNDLTTKLLTEKLGGKEFQNGFIMDGYPRNLSHVPIFNQILSDLDYKLFAVFHFDVEKERLFKRLDGRVICGGCGEVFNNLLLPPDTSTCNKCGQQLNRRKDDTPEVLEKRLQVYDQETVPLIQFFKDQKLLLPVLCADDPEQVTKQLLDALVMLEEYSLEDTLDSFSWLQSQMNNVRYLNHETDRSTLLTRFRDKALKENLHNRTGIMRRFVYLKTTNVKKFKEYTNIFTGLYGIEVLRLPPDIPEHLVKGLLLLKDKDLVPLAVFREESNLYRPNSEEFCSLNHGVRAINRARLWSYTLDKDKNIQQRLYEYSTVGRIDLNRRVSFFNPDDVFGWDDIFVLESNGLSYHQLQQSGIKRSSRDMVISDFLSDNIHYKKFLDVEFNKQTPHRVIDFNVSVSDFVEKNQYYNNPFAIQYGYRNLQNHVLNFGVFFRAAKNRRQNNYWNPGLNGGIPLTKKKDEIHEITFMAHDFGHFAIPDLIFVGTNSVNHRRAYIMWRMASEATTMALADMLFVDSLQKSGVQYDFNTRRIYPLFQDLGLEFSNPQTYAANLKRVIHANFQYCLTGNDQLYRKLLQESGKDFTNLDRFEEKFMPFFVEDFRWTEHNYDNMLKRSDEMRRWWQSILPIRQLSYLNLKSIDDFLLDLGDLNDAQDDEFLDQVFEKVFEHKVRPVLEQKASLLPEATRLQRAFTRYMAGQLAIFAKYYFISESALYQEKIISQLLAHESGMTQENVNEIRRIYEEYLSLLVSKNLISKDDQATFSELYPLFDPYYVTYDQDLSAYENLSAISQRILSLKTHHEKQLSQIEQKIGRLLEDSEKRYLSHISLLIEESDGQIQDGLFVVKPGVMLLAETHWNEKPGSLAKEAQITFLLAGISIETSLEFIAHKEAKVARLTSSKTNAMNIPLFRVQGLDTWAQRKYIAEVMKQRVKFENAFQPRKLWENGSEIFNISAPACKTTALCYTMSLKDLHKLFIGRMGPNGNESEVREVVRTMATLLHKKYPQFILSPEEYLNFNNAEKYKAQTVETTNESAPSPLEIHWEAQTVVMKQGLDLFRKLNLAPNQPHYISLSEFCSRITYLAFPKTPETAEQSNQYLSKMTHEFNHYSVVAAFQVGLVIGKKVSDATLGLLRSFGILEIRNDEYHLLLSLKELHQMLIQWASLGTDKNLLQEVTSAAHKKFSVVIKSSYSN